MKLLNYFSMVKYMVCTDVKLFIFFWLSKKAGKITRNKPNFWMYHNADHYFYLVFAKKRGFFVFFGCNQYLACVNEWLSTW